MISSITIVEAQNDPKQLTRLAAQRRLYSRAKLLFGFRTSISLLIAFTGAATASLCPELKSVVTFIALPLSLLDNLCFDPLQKRWIADAAKIQEMFDTDVLALRWVSIKYGRRLDEEVVHDLGSEGSQASGLGDWYPVAIAELPVHLGRLICQRSNCIWDRRLRERYALAVFVLLILTGLAVFFIGIRGEWSVQQFVLAVLVPLTPGLLIGVRHYSGLLESNRSLEKLSGDVERAWSEALKRPSDIGSATETSRDIQNQLYDHRKNGQVIFDWLYQLLRRRDEAAMQKRAEELVREANAAF